MSVKDEYPGTVEVVPDVFIAAGDAVYIADEKGEVVTWNHDEIAEDGEAFTAALNGVILATLGGANAVRDNLSSHGERLRELIEATMLGVNPHQPWSVLYECKGTIHQCGPFKNEAEADEYAKKTQAEGEFDIRHQRIYLLTPDHRMIEYGIDDLTDEDN